MNQRTNVRRIRESLHDGKTHDTFVDRCDAKHNGSPFDVEIDDIRHQIG